MTFLTYTLIAFAVYWLCCILYVVTIPAQRPPEDVLSPAGTWNDSDKNGLLQATLFIIYLGTMLAISLMMSLACGVHRLFKPNT